MDYKAPGRRKLSKSTNQTHLILILVTVIVIVNKINLETEIGKKQINEPRQNLHILLKLVKRNHLMKRSDKMEKTLALLLILLSNDVPQNPGPKPEKNENCTLCKEPTQKANSLQCNTCKKWCHLTCSNLNRRSPTSSPRNGRFQWVCPTARCQPNLSSNTQNQAELVAVNRYKPHEIPQQR